MNKLRFFLFALIYFATVSITLAQTSDIELIHYPELDTFNLKNYILPVLKYDRLDFSFFLNSNNDSNFRYTKDNNEFEINSGIYLSNYSYRNSPRLQFRGNNSLYLSGGYEKRYDLHSDELQKNKGVESELDIDNSFRFYNNSKRFFEFDFKSNLNIKDGKYRRFYINDYNKGTAFSVNLGFYIGYGRIEDVTDAWRAIRMLKDFKRIGKLTKLPNGEDVTTLANALAKSRNFRIFDNRVKRTEQLKAIDEVIFDRNLVNNNDIAYFASLYDLFSLYQYYEPRRSTGNIVSIGLIPYYNVFNSKGEINRDFSGYGLSFELKNEYYKPINMFYQFDFGYSLVATYSNSINTLNTISPDKYILVNPRIFADFSYFPSTRTVLTSKFSIGYTKDFKLDSEVKSNTFILNSAWRNRLTYYLSPRSKMNLNLYMYHIHTGKYTSVSISNGEWIPYRYIKNGIFYQIPKLTNGFTYFLSFEFKYAIF